MTEQFQFRSLLTDNSISWTICKSFATTQVYHHSVFPGHVLFLMPIQHCQSTASKKKIRNMIVKVVLSGLLHLCVCQMLWFWFIYLHMYLLCKLVAFWNYYTTLVICNVFLVVCILEGSGKWPNSFDAIKRLKAAYYLSLSQALSKIAPSVLSAAYTSYLEVYKVCSKIVWNIDAVQLL